MGKFPGHSRSAYSGIIYIGTGFKSALSRVTLSTCRSDTRIMGSGHVRLYPLDTVPTCVKGDPPQCEGTMPWQDGRRVTGKVPCELHFDVPPA